MRKASEKKTQQKPVTEKQIKLKKMESLVVLDDSQLRRLSKLIRDQENLRIQDIQFGSEYERVSYLRDCSNNYKTIGTLLDTAAALLEEHKADQTKSPIAAVMYDQMIGLVTNALEGIPNYTVRRDFLAKVVDYTDDAAKQLRQLDPADEASVQLVSEDAETFKTAINNFNATHGSKASDEFAKRINEQGLSFEQLVTRYKQKLGFMGPFEDLTEGQKFLVYEAIIRDSGRGPIVDKTHMFTRSAGKLVAGVAVLGFAVAATVWDIYSTPTKDLLEKSTRAAMDMIAGIGGGLLGDYLAVALMNTQLAAMVGATALVTVAGFILGAAAGFLLGALAGMILDTIFGSGGHVPSTLNFQIYVAPMPDGIALARKIAKN